MAPVVFATALSPGQGAENITHLVSPIESMLTQAHQRVQPTRKVAYPGESRGYAVQLESNRSALAP
jgi:hypothetical protein